MDGKPVSGMRVFFAAPAAGASASLSTTIATTDTSGVASVIATANSITGTYPVTATFNNIIVQFVLTNLPKSVARNDLDGDGRSEIVVETFGPHQLNYVHMRADGSWYDYSGLLSSPAFSSNVAGSGDVNMDGKSDLVFQNGTTGAIGVWFMNGRTVTSTVGLLPNPALTWNVCGVADFDIDGHADVLLQDSATGKVAEWRMDGTGYWKRRVLLGSPGIDWKITGTGDIVGDRIPDLVLQNVLTGDVAVWLLNGDAVVAGGVVGTPGPLWKAIAVADFNADGRSDIILQNTQTADVAEWLMDGTTIIAGGIIGTPGPLWTVVGAGDFNGDGMAHVILVGGAPPTSDRTLAQWEVRNGAVVRGVSGLLTIRANTTVIVVN